MLICDKISVRQRVFLSEFCVGCSTFSTYQPLKNLLFYLIKGSEMIRIQAHVITLLHDGYSTACSRVITCALGFLSSLSLYSVKGRPNSCLLRDSTVVQRLLERTCTWHLSQAGPPKTGPHQLKNLSQGSDLAWTAKNCLAKLAIVRNHQAGG